MAILPLAIADLANDVRQRILGIGPHAALAAIADVQVWRVNDPNDLPQGAAEFAVDVRIPTGVLFEPAGLKAVVVGGVGVQMNTSAILVALYKRVPAGFRPMSDTENGGGYATAEDAALAKMVAIRKRLTGEYAPDVGGACTSGGIRYLGQVQGGHPGTKGWYRVTLTLEAKHLIEVGE